MRSWFNIVARTETVRVGLDRFNTEMPVEPAAQILETVRLSRHSVTGGQGLRARGQGRAKADNIVSRIDGVVSHRTVPCF